MLPPVFLGITVLAFPSGGLSPDGPVEMLLSQNGDVMPTEEQIAVKNPRHAYVKRLIVSKLLSNNQKRRG